jgi:hypothetical protein
MAFTMFTSIGTLVDVAGENSPSPSYSVDYSLTASLDDAIIIKITGSNGGESAKVGDIHLAFPCDPNRNRPCLDKNHLQIESTDAPQSDIYWPPPMETDDRIGGNYGRGEYQVKYPIAIAFDEDGGWQSGETHYLSVKVRPIVTGVLEFEAKMTIQDYDGTWYGSPKEDGSEPSIRDQQDEYAETFSISVALPSVTSQFRVEFNDLDVTSGFHGERLVRYSSPKTLSPPEQDRPAQTNGGYYEHQVYDRVRSGYVFDPVEGIWKTKFEVYYPSTTISDTDPDNDGFGGNDYTIISERTVLLLLHYYWYGKVA